MALAVASLFLATAQAAHAGPTYVVNTLGFADNATTPANGVCDTDTKEPGNQCTFMAAIENAEVTPGATITFSLGQGRQSVTSLAQGVPAGTTIDGTTQPGWTGAPLITIVSAGSLTLGKDVTVRGLDLTGGQDSVLSASSNDTIVGNYIGIDSDGETPRGGGIGVLVLGSNNDIGGVRDKDRNVISGCSTGIEILGIEGQAQPTGNHIEGNIIGLDAAGRKAVPNRIGVYIFGASDNTIGGNLEGQGNVISGNSTSDPEAVGYGIEISSRGSANQGGSSVGNKIVGNEIGTDETGTRRIGNDVGISLEGASDTLIGGKFGSSICGDGGTCNLISGNFGTGIEIERGPEDRHDSESTILGDFVGTNRDGTKPLANGYGIRISDAFATHVGDKAESICRLSCVLVSGNEHQGIWIGPGAVATKVSGDAIGLDASELGPLPNGTAGGDAVEVAGGEDTVVGGSNPNPFRDCLEDCDYISGNAGSGVLVDANTPVAGQVRHVVTIAGDIIGLDAAGRGSRNAGSGISVIDTSGVAIGGSGEDDGNLIVDNGHDGITIRGSRSRNVFIEGNRIGIDAAEDMRGNGGSGIAVDQNAHNITIGGSERVALDKGCAGACNVISTNGRSGISITDSRHDFVESNYIGMNSLGTKPRPNATVGVELLRSDDVTIGGTNGTGNLISNRAGQGISVLFSGDIRIYGNLIGVDKTGEKDISGSSSGVYLTCDKCVLGAPGAPRNFIFGGVGISGNDNIVQHNTLGLTRDEKERDRYRPQVYVSSGVNNLIGGGRTSEGNDIVGSEAATIRFGDGVKRTTIVANNYFNGE